MFQMMLLLTCYIEWIFEMKPHKGSSPFSVILSFMIMASNKITDFAFLETLYMLIFHFWVDLKFLLLLNVVLQVLVTNLESVNSSKFFHVHFVVVVCEIHGNHSRCSRIPLLQVFLLFWDEFLHLCLSGFCCFLSRKFSQWSFLTPWNFQKTCV